MVNCIEENRDGIELSEINNANINTIYFDW